MMCKQNDVFVKKFVLDHSREEDGGQRGDLKSFFFNVCLIIVSHVLMFFKNDFLNVFGTSQEVSQEPFGGHLGYLLEQLVG